MGALCFLVEKGNRSGSRRTVESYSRMLCRSSPVEEKLSRIVVSASSCATGGSNVIDHVAADGSKNVAVSVDVGGEAPL